MPAAIPIVAAVGGALVSNAGAKKAASIQANAANAATALQREQWETTREDQAPYREAGYEALRQLGSFVEPSLRADDVMSEPGYQFGLQQGLNNIQSTAAARGSLYSGAALKDLTRFGTDYASTRYNDAWNRQQAAAGNRWGRLSALAGIGQTANQQVQAAGANWANAAGNIGMSNANAQGAAGMAQANTWGNALNQIGSAAGRTNWGQVGSTMGSWFGGSAPSGPMGSYQQNPFQANGV